MKTYFSMNKRIKKLEDNVNTVDYPDDLLKNKKWTLNYIDQLYECSVNGARSVKSLSYLKKINNTVHALIVGGSVLFVVLVIVVVTLCGRK